VKSAKLKVQSEKVKYILKTLFSCRAASCL